MSILSSLNVYHFDNKFRLGNNRDGGYVIADLSNNYDLIIGAGVGNDISFEKSFLMLEQFKDIELIKNYVKETINIFIFELKENN
jgi:hypothetical protein